MASLTRTAAAVTTWEVKITQRKVFQNLQHLKLLAVEHVYFYERCTLFNKSYPHNQ